MHIFDVTCVADDLVHLFEADTGIGVLGQDSLIFLAVGKANDQRFRLHVVPFHLVPLPGYDGERQSAVGDQSQLESGAF